METVKERKKEEKWFLTHHLKSNLKSRSIKGGVNTVGAQGVSFILNTASTFILARLLAPEDFGLVAMVTAVTGFVTIFKDMGLSAAVIQKENLEQLQVSAVFWINVVISLGLALLISLIGPLLVSFYNEDRLFLITVVFGTAIFISSFSLQHNALMKRQMQFKTLSYIQIVSATASLFCSLLVVWIGLGYWAIVASTVLPTLFSTAILWFVCDWRPSMPQKTKGVGAFLKFGAGVTGFDLINYFSRNMDNVLIGKFIGSGPLGLYTKAYQLLLLPITRLRDPLNAVAIPGLSTLQNEKEKFRAYYRKYVFTLSFFSMPLVMFLAVFSEELILIVLGPQWTEASIVFQLLAISSFIQPVASTRGVVLISTGQTKKYFMWGIINSVFVIIGFAIGIKYGLEGIALSYALVNYVILIPSLYFCFSKSPVKVSMFFKETSFPIAFSFFSGFCMLASKQYLEFLSPFLLLPVGFIFGLITYLAPWYISRNSRNKLEHLTEIRNMLFGKISKKFNL